MVVQLFTARGAGVIDLKVGIKERTVATRRTLLARATKQGNLRVTRRERTCVWMILFFDHDLWCRVRMLRSSGNIDARTTGYV